MDILNLISIILFVCCLIFVVNFGKSAEVDESYNKLLEYSNRQEELIKNYKILLEYCNNRTTENKKQYLKECNENTKIIKNKVINIPTDSMKRVYIPTNFNLTENITIAFSFLHGVEVLPKFGNRIPCSNEFFDYFSCYTFINYQIVNGIKEERPISDILDMYILKHTEAFNGELEMKICDTKSCQLEKFIIT